MAADKITVLFPRSDNHNEIQRGVFSPTTKLIFFFFLTPWSNTVNYFATLSLFNSVVLKSTEGYQQQCPGGSQQRSMTTPGLQAQFVIVAV